MMRGMLDGGLLSSPERQAVTFSDSKTWHHASRSANPQRRSAGICPSNPVESAKLNTSSAPARCFLSFFHDSSRQIISCLSLGTKYGASDVDLTFIGDVAISALSLARTNKN